MPIIKRYPNRKLYDTEAKRYVTLDQIAEMIQARRDVLVIDHETGEDLTNLTLSQIIFEQEKKGAGFLQRSLLANLIRAGGDTLDQMRRALTAPLHLDSGEKKEGTPQGTLDALLFHRIDELMQDILTTLNVPTARDLRKLQAQLDELNEKISALLAAEEGNTAGNEQKPETNAAEQRSPSADHEAQ